MMLLSSCGKKEEQNNIDDRQARSTMTENYVDTMTLRSVDFRHQVVCNGTLAACVKSQLSMRHPDIITKIDAKTGQAVTKGQLLAVTEEEKYQRALDKARRDLEKAEIEFTDKLISLGYDNKDGVPDDILKRAEVTSGLFAARHQMTEAEQDLADCRLYAPFTGRVADLEGKLYQKGDKLCTLIDESAFDVDFSVLESELSSIAVGYDVGVIPLVGNQQRHNGKITAINPSVSNKGLVKVTARIPGAKGLIDGMNVKAVVERTEPNMLVVPKDAVVERDGYNVVFVYRDGQAVWTYVDIAASNISSHAITGCQRKDTEIHPGEIIITSGNMNLADGTEVIPR